MTDATTKSRWKLVTRSNTWDFTFRIRCADPEPPPFVRFPDEVFVDVHDLGLDGVLPKKKEP